MKIGSVLLSIQLSFHRFLRPTTYLQQAVESILLAQRSSKVCLCTHYLLPFHLYSLNIIYIPTSPCRGIDMHACVFLAVLLWYAIWYGGSGIYGISDPPDGMKKLSTHPTKEQSSRQEVIFFGTTVQTTLLLLLK